MSAGPGQLIDIADFVAAHWGMRVTPMPRRGAVLAGRDAAARMLRVSYHPDVERVVVSIWDHDICVATLRLAPEDVPELVRGLTAALVEPAPPLGPAADSRPSPSRTQPAALRSPESPWQRPGPVLPPVPMQRHRGPASA